MKNNINENQIKLFEENINYIIDKTEKNLININKFDNEKFFELTKEEIIECFEELVLTMKNWKKYLNNNKISNIQKEYKKIESNVSELELCLVDYDDIFHCEGIAYSLYEIGKLLIEILKEEVSN